LRHGPKSLSSPERAEMCVFRQARGDSSLNLGLEMRGWLPLGRGAIRACVTVPSPSVHRNRKVGVFPAGSDDSSPNLSPRARRPTSSRQFRSAERFSTLGLRMRLPCKPRNKSQSAMDEKERSRCPLRPVHRRQWPSGNCQLLVGLTSHSRVVSTGFCRSFI
jgi:hypothetical protein